MSTALILVSCKKHNLSGVVNVVTASRPNTPAVGEILCTSPKIAGMSFTGENIKLSCNIFEGEVIVKNRIFSFLGVN